MDNHKKNFQNYFKKLETCSHEELILWLLANGLDQAAAEKLAADIDHDRQNIQLIKKVMPELFLE